MATSVVRNYSSSTVANRSLTDDNFFANNYSNFSSFYSVFSFVKSQQQISFLSEQNFSNLDGINTYLFNDSTTLSTNSTDFNNINTSLTNYSNINLLSTNTAITNLTVGVDSADPEYAKTMELIQELFADDCIFRPTPENYLMIAAFCIIFCLSVIGNSIVVVVIVQVGLILLYYYNYYNYLTFENLI